MPRFGIEIEEIERKHEELEELLHRGWPVIPTKPGSKESLVSAYAKYADHPPTSKQWDRWLAKFPECGMGIVTGGELVALDWDRSDVSAFPTGLFQTTLIRTPRGWHSMFTASGGMPSVKPLALTGGECEFFGIGKFAITEPAKGANGKPYERITGWDDIAPLPEEVKQAVERQHAKHHPLTPNHSRIIRHAAITKRDRDCIRQFLARDLPYGERNDAIFALSVQCKQSGVPQANTEDWVRVLLRDGITDKRDMNERRVLRIVRSAYTGKGKGYNMSCESIRQQHGWIQCERCGTLNRRVIESMEPGFFMSRAYQLFRGDAEGLAIAGQLILLGSWRDLHFIYKRIAEEIGIDPRTVADRIEKMRAAGLLPSEDKSQWLSF